MTITKVSGGLVLMFHYVYGAENAKAISQKGVISPSDDYLHLLNGTDMPDKPYVALTDITPEEGRSDIATAMGMSEGSINFGLEILVDAKGLSQPNHTPGAYRIYSDKNVPVKVLRIWSMDRVAQKISSGHTIHRFIGHNKLPYAFYERK